MNADFNKHKDLCRRIVSYMNSIYDEQYSIYVVKDHLYTDYVCLIKDSFTVHCCQAAYEELLIYLINLNINSTKTNIFKAAYTSLEELELQLAIRGL